MSIPVMVMGIPRITVHRGEGGSRRAAYAVTRAAWFGRADRRGGQWE